MAAVPSAAAEVAVEAGAEQPLAAEAAVAGSAALTAAVEVVAVTLAGAGVPAAATHGTAADGRVDGMVAIIIVIAVAVSGRALAPA